MRVGLMGAVGLRVKGLLLVAAVAAVIGGLAPAAAVAASQYRVMYDSQNFPSGLWTRNLDGSNPQSFQAGAYNASWNQKGTKLVFLDSEGNCGISAFGNVYVENADGTGMTSLGVSACRAEISPDGQHVLYVAGASSGFDGVFVVGTAPNSQPVQVLPLPNNGCSSISDSNVQNACTFPWDPSWKGNGTIAFTIGLSANSTGIWTVPSGGGTAPSEITATDKSLGYLWLNGTGGSFDGSTVAASGVIYSNDIPGPEGIWTTTGGGPTVVAEPANNSQNQYIWPQFSADGQLITFENYIRDNGPPYTNSVYIVASGGGTPTDITPDDPTAAYPTFAPPASPGTISGTITAGKSSNPVPAAGVTVSASPQNGGSPVTTTTGSDGSYSMQVSSGTYTVTPSGTPTGQQQGGHYTPSTCSGTPGTGVCTVEVGAAQTETASFTYGSKNRLSGTVTYASGDKSAVKNMTITITGFTTDFNSVNMTVTTDQSGNYSADLDPGTYTVTPDPKFQPTPTASSDCSVSGAACKVNMDQDRTANFTVKCQPTLDFHTSMVATGCFVPVDAAAGTWKAQGQFRMDGLDFQSPDDSTDPVMFDDQKKTVEGSQVKFSLSAPGFGSGYLGFYVPGGLHMSFPFTEEKMTWAFNKPWAQPGGVVGKGIGFLSAPFGGTQTLFGFPAHAPAVELTFDPGQTTLQMQISFPPTTGAFLDPINGLWKIPNGRGGVKIDYPLAFRVKITATNDSGVSAIEGSVAFANVYGVDTSNNKFVAGESGAPQIGTVELARLGFNWQLAQGVLHGTALLVIHNKSSAAAMEYAQKYLGPLNAFLGKTLVTVDAAFKWVTALGNLPVPGLVNLNVQVNNINKLIPDTPGLFWQRFGLDGGIDTSSPLSPWTIGGNVGFTFLPRFKSDYVWFQEVASLDGSTTFDFDPFSFNGTLDLKVAGATILHGSAKLDHTGLFLSGDLGLDLNQVLRVRFPASFKGTGRFSLPTNAPTLFGGWQLDGEGKINVWTTVLDGKVVLNSNGFGWCGYSNKTGTRGAYFDGTWHVGGCNSGPFVSAISTGANSNEPTGSLGPNDKRTFVAASAAAKTPSFTLTRHSHVSAIAVLGTSAPPQFVLHGPDGLTLTTPTTTDALIASPVSLVVNTSDRTTYLLLKGARAGRYTLTLLAGSPPVAGLQFSEPLPPPSVHATIATQGCGRVLRWHLRSLPGQKVTIEEQGTSSPRPLAVTNRPTGIVAYTPDPGTPAGRTIIAVVTQQGSPRATIVLAHIRASTGTPPAKVSGLHARRTSTKITLSWSPACAASYYYVAFGTGSAADSLTTARTTATIKVAKKAHRIPVSVTAVGPANQGAPPARITVP